MKKLFALLLAVIMVISMAACAPAEPAGTTTEAPKSTTAAKETTTAATTTEAPVDLSATPFVEPGSVKLTIGIPINATVLDYNDNYFTKKIEEVTGIDLEFDLFPASSDEVAQQLTLRVANGEKLPDILINIVKNQTVAGELGEAGKIADLTDLWEGGYAYWADQHLELMSDSEKATFWAKMVNPADGKIYFYPQYSNSISDDHDTYIGGINEVMAEKVGMVATEIDTVAEVYEFLKKTVNEDGNGNGKKDELGLVTPLNCGYRPDVLLWVINAYVYCNDTYKWNVTDGELWSPYDTDEYRKALIELNKWYKEGLISPLCYSIANLSEMKALMDADVDTVCLFGDTPTVVTAAETTIGERYTGLNVLKDETGKGGYANMRNTYSLNTRVVFSADCENLELAFRLMDLMSRKDFMNIARYGEEGYGWETIDGEAENGKTLIGLWADRKILNDEWSKESNQTWKNNVFGIQTIQGQEAGISNTGGARADLNTRDRGYTMRYTTTSLLNGEYPEERVFDLVYNTDETAVNEEYSDFSGFIKESRAQFITGVLDPSNDADWDKYLKELESNGQSDLLEVAQSAYDRMYG